MREQRNEGTAERGIDWNDTTSAQFKKYGYLLPVYGQFLCLHLALAWLPTFRLEAGDYRLEALRIRVFQRFRLSLMPGMPFGERICTLQCENVICIQRSYSAVKANPVRS